MILDVEELDVKFEKDDEVTHAVNNLSFQIEQGEMVALVGESGCGKSVTAKALMRLLPKRTARVKCNRMQLDQINLLTDAPIVRGSEIAMILQDPISALNPTKKIGKQVGECVRRRDPSLYKWQVKQRVLDLLAMVRLPHPQFHYDQYPFELSGGMCQRVCIAMAFACSPKLIIADEPTTALDVTIQAQILSLMKELQQQMRTSVLLITHDLSIVARYCDRAMVMYAGEIVESASTLDLFDSPKHPYTQLLLRSVPTPTEQPLVPIEGQPPKLNQTIEGCPFCPRCPEAMAICRLKRPPIANGYRCWKEEAE